VSKAHFPIIASQTALFSLPRSIGAAGTPNRLTPPSQTRLVTTLYFAERVKFAPGRPILVPVAIFLLLLHKPPLFRYQEASARLRDPIDCIRHPKLDRLPLSTLLKE
jgi:hypothetical protein